MAERMFKAGDQVQLQSGGPIMTVENYSGEKMVTCIWFEGGKGAKKSDSFVEDTLKKFKRQAPRAVRVGRR